MPPEPQHRKKPSELTGNELEVLAAAMRNDLCHLPVTDAFVISSGTVSRAGRSMRAARYVEQLPGRVVWLPYVAGAGKGRNDHPARVWTITDAGRAALRARMGESSYAQLETLAEEATRWYRTGVPGSVLEKPQ
jgi:hypothetical protein